MTNPDTFPLLVVAQLVWKDAGWAIIIFLAALTTVDARAVRGGRGGRRRPVAADCGTSPLPALRTVIVLLLILRIGDT